jgi:D-aspartate ligase
MREAQRATRAAGRMTPESDVRRPRTAVRRSAFDEIDTSTPVLVLTASPRARRAPHTGLGILRSLGRLGIPVHTVDSNPRGPSSYSRYLRRRFIFDLAGASPDAVVEHLLLAGRRLGTRAILVPTWDDLAIVIADAEPALREQFLLPRQPDGLARSLVSKKEMQRLAVVHGVPTPEVSFPTSVDDVRAFAADATFPVMIKGIFGNRLHQRAGHALFIAERPADLIRLYLDLEDPANPNLMLQEYIPGGDDAVWMFNGYFDADSECLFGLTGRKLRQTPAYAGTTSLGVCLPNETVDGLTRRWMKALGYRGMLDMGYRYDARDGQYKVLDVNPRIGSTFRLFVGRRGLDVVRALYLDLTGQAVPADEMVEGRRWLDEHDFSSSLRYLRDGKLTLRQWATSLRGLQETIYLAQDDLAPFVRLGPYALRSRLRRRRR